jgi:hypothetical protein
MICSYVQQKSVPQWLLKPSRDQGIYGTDEAVPFVKTLFPILLEPSSTQAQGGTADC